MSSLYHDGHKHLVAGGIEVTHSVVEGPAEGERDHIALAIQLPTGDDGQRHGAFVKLTADEAQKLATSLLRDVSLVRYGFG